MMEMSETQQVPPELLAAVQAVLRTPYVFPELDTLRMEWVRFRSEARDEPEPEGPPLGRVGE